MAEDAKAVIASSNIAVKKNSDFFFQAEDGIRGSPVTGVQTCALPIYRISILLKS